MARYSLGKAVGTTDKGTSSRSTPIATEGLAFDSSVGEIPKIKQPRIAPQKWQGDTYISNPSPTLAPQLDLPDLGNVLAEPQRDFGRLADALSGLNKQLVGFGTAQTKYEGAMQKLATNDANAIIQQTSVEGTASQKMANLNSKLESIVQDPKASEEDKNYAERTLNRIKTESRLKPAIESAYREQAVLNKAAGLNEAAKTAVINEIVEQDNGSKKEIQVPVNTLSPNDPRYIKWANSYVFDAQSKKLTSFEYKNVKGQLATYLANARTAQGKTYSTYLNNEYVGAFNVDTANLGTQFAEGKITKEQVIFNIEALLERGRINLVDKSVRTQLEENLVENIIVAYMKANPKGNINDLRPIFEGIMTGPIESRVIKKTEQVTVTTQAQADKLGLKIGDVYTNEYGVRNDNQLWLKQFPVGYLEARISDARVKLALNDEDSQKVINGIEETNSLGLFKKEVFPLLAGEQENLPLALKKLNELRATAIEAADGDGAKIDAINKAYDKRENTLFGVFSVDYNSDKDSLDKAMRDALIDDKKIAIFNRKLTIFKEKWSGYNKADTYINGKAVQYQRLFDKLETSQLEPIKGVISASKEYYIKTIGREEKTGYNTLDEEARWTLIEKNILDDYYSGIDLEWNSQQLDEYNRKFTEQFTGPNKKQFIEKYMPSLQIEKKGVKPLVVEPSYKGSLSDGLSTWESQALSTKELQPNGNLNEVGRDRIRLLYESDTPLLSRDALVSLPISFIKTGQIDRRLKVIVNNLPGEARGKLGTFILNQMLKHNMNIPESERIKILKLDDTKLAQSLDTRSILPA